MTQSNLKLIPVAVLLGGLALPVGAASSAASSASDSVAASVGSLSGSVQQSSNSSSKDRQVTDGDYKIIEVALEDGRPGMVRLTLAALATATPAAAAAGAAPAENFYLYLPHPVLVESGLAEGATIGARQRPYGLEFDQGQPRRAFFLALNDAWYRELQTTAVAL